MLSAQHFNRGTLQPQMLRFYPLLPSHRKPQQPSVGQLHAQCSCHCVFAQDIVPSTRRGSVFHSSKLADALWSRTCHFLTFSAVAVCRLSQPSEDIPNLISYSQILPWNILSMKIYRGLLFYYQVNNVHRFTSTYFKAHECGQPAKNQDNYPEMYGKVPMSMSGNDSGWCSGPPLCLDQSFLSCQPRPCALQSENTMAMEQPRTKICIRYECG